MPKDHGDSSVFKLVLQTISIAFTLGILGFTWWLGVNYVTIDPKQWSMFFNAKLPLIVTQVGTVVFALIALDLAYKGWTVQSIVYVTKESPWQDKAVAAFFILGFLYIICLACKGGF